MKNELIKQFIKKTIRKVFIFAFIMIVVAAIGDSMSPVISNELALTQMELDNTMFVVMTAYYRIKPLITFVYSCVILWFVYTIGRDTYKFAKTINTDENKEI